jgi:peptidyl-prolyl cis-trans isomerase A (cyclophilin A)
MLKSNMHGGSLVVILAVCWVLVAPGRAGEETSPGEFEKNDESVYAVMQTSLGDIVIELDTVRAPITCANFLEYAESGFYDSTIFHRVVAGFVIQGGGFTIDLTKKPTREPIENEWKNGLKNARGTIAMARLGGKPNSATSQFFINVKDNFSLDRPRDGAGYAVFGTVVDGMDVVDRIRQVKVGTVRQFSNVPLESVVIETVVRLKDEESKEAEKSADEKTESSDSLLFLAIREGDTLKVRGLLAQGADIKVHSEAGHTPLHMAAEGGFGVIVEMLIKGGADVNAVDNYGETPLHLAARKDRVEAARMLIGAGADVNAEDREGRTALDLAVHFGNEKVAGLLRVPGGID